MRKLVQVLSAAVIMSGGCNDVPTTVQAPDRFLNPALNTDEIGRLLFKHGPYTLTQNRHASHAGIDMKGATDNAVVYSPIDGNVIAARSACGVVGIEDDGPLSTWPGDIAAPRHFFVHLDPTSIDLSMTKVRKGQPIGRMAEEWPQPCPWTGPHVHYEIRRNYTGIFPMACPPSCDVFQGTYDPFAYNFETRAPIRLFARDDFEVNNSLRSSTHIDAGEFQNHTTWPIRDIDWFHLTGHPNPSVSRFLYLQNDDAGNTCFRIRECFAAGSEFFCPLDPRTYNNALGFVGTGASGSISERWVGVETVTCGTFGTVDPNLSPYRTVSYTARVEDDFTFASSSGFVDSMGRLSQNVDK